MKTMRWVCVAGLMGIVSAGAVWAGERVEGFAELKAGDKLEMGFGSVGCFHSYAYDLTFTRAPKPMVEVAAVWWELDSARPGTNYNVARKGLGKLELSQKDLTGLDTLLVFYRTNRQGGCTTTDTIKISQVHDGKVVATEKFVDASCGVCDERVNGALSVDALVRRLPKGKESK